MSQGSTDLVDMVLSLDGPAALARKREVELRLSDIRNGKGPSPRPDERETLKRENEALGVRLGEWKEAQKAENLRRNMAGLGSPLHEALTERFPELVPELERVAFEKLAARVKKNSDRKANKTGEKK